MQSIPADFFCVIYNVFKRSYYEVVENLSI